MGGGGITVERISCSIGLHLSVHICKAGPALPRTKCLTQYLAHDKQQMAS